MNNPGTKCETPWRNAKTDPPPEHGPILILENEQDPEHPEFMVARFFKPWGKPDHWRGDHGQRVGFKWWMPIPPTPGAGED